MRDGLTRIDRIILTELNELERERGDRGVKTAMLYGRIVARGINVTPEEFQELIARLARLPR